MKKSKKMQILFFSLIPVGIILLIFSIKWVSKTFSGNVILDMPYLQGTADFMIEKSGTYTIWHKGPFWRKAPLDEFRPVIINESTGEEPHLTSNLFRPNSNNGVTARMELFRFKATAGHYRIELREGSSISGIENALIRKVPAKKVEPDKYFIQVRSSRPFILGILGIILITFAGICIIGGLVFGILADQIFKN